MKTFKQYITESVINEAEYNKEWWDSKSDLFKKKYIEKHPNSIYAQKSGKKPTPSKNNTNVIRNKIDTIKDKNLKKQISDSIFPSPDNDARHQFGDFTRKEQHNIEKSLKNGYEGITVDKYVDIKKKLNALAKKDFIPYSIASSDLEWALGNNDRNPKAAKQVIDLAKKLTTTEYGPTPLELRRGNKVLGKFKSRKDLKNFINKNKDKIDYYDLSLSIVLKDKNGNVVFTNGVTD